MFSPCSYSSAFIVSGRISEFFFITDFDNSFIKYTTLLVAVNSCWAPLVNKV